MLIGNIQVLETAALQVLITDCGVYRLLLRYAAQNSSNFVCPPQPQPGISKSGRGKAVWKREAIARFAATHVVHFSDRYSIPFQDINFPWEELAIATGIPCAVRAKLPHFIS